MERHENHRKQLAKAKRIVVKIGTSSLTDSNSKLAPAKIGKFVSDTMGLRSRGKELIIVSSGAIATGVGCLNLESRPKEISALQATAAVGQSTLMQVYSRYFGEYQQPVAQILLTAEDLRDAKRYKNFKNVLSTLMKWGVVPIINENDSVASEEVKVGDNDILSAHVSIGVKADLLVLLSDVEGLYMDYAKKGNNGRVIRMVGKTADVERYASKFSRGSGGMLSKIRAARMVNAQGVPAVIAGSAEDKVLEKIIEGREVGTLFLPERKR